MGHTVWSGTLLDVIRASVRREQLNAVSCAWSYRLMPLGWDWSLFRECWSAGIMITSLVLGVSWEYIGAWGRAVSKGKWLLA